MTAPAPKDRLAVESECRVVLVDDSPSFRMMLGQLLRRVRGLTVVGEATDGEAALHLCAELRPDVVVMDVMMPKLDGVAAARLLLQRSPAAVVLLSIMVRYPEHRAALAGLPADRVTLLDKPTLVGEGGQLAAARLATELFAARARNEQSRKVARQRPTHCQLVAIAASAGGMEALRGLLCQVTADVPPVVIAQHLPSELDSNFAATLGQMLPVPLHAVTGRAELRPGHLYTAAHHSHLMVERDLVRSHEADPGRLAPSADQLFFSVAAAYGEAALGIVLTGMGRDGAEGLLALRNAGGWTVTQAEPAVDGMPRAAKESGGSCESLPLWAIAELLGALRLPAPQSAGKQAR